MLNTFGNIYRLTAFGESHGEAVGGVIDGLPAGIPLDLDAVQAELSRRRPGQSEITTARDEKDRVRILSGLFEGRTTGTPLAFIVENADQHSADYDNMRDICRPSHADYTYNIKYGVRAHRGGGRSSARTTIAHVVAGAVAMQALADLGVEIAAYVSGVGHIDMPGDPLASCPTRAEMLRLIDANPVRCPDADTAELMRELILKVKGEGDTVGGTVSCIIRNCPAGLGEPVFGKLQALLASAMMNINAAKAFEYGMGFAGCRCRGSEMVDLFGDPRPDGSATTLTNNSGGIQGGISNGMDINFRVGFKPVATLLKEIPAIDRDGRPATLRARGRHDPCVVPRAVPVVEAMAAAVILDAYLMDRARR